MAKNLWKYFNPFLFSFVVLLGSAVGSQPQDQQEVIRQIQKLDDDLRKLNQDYVQQKKDLAQRLQDQLKGLGQSPADRLKRKELMRQAQERLRQLRDSFKLEAASIQEAKESLQGPRGPVALKSTPAQMRREYHQMKNLQRRIQRQNQLFPPQKEIQKKEEKPGEPKVKTPSSASSTDKKQKK